MKDKRVEMIKCACGCGESLNKYDGNYRTRKYISGHNGRKYEDPTEHKRAWYHKTKEDRKEVRSEWKRNSRKSKKLSLLLRRGGECAACKTKSSEDTCYMFDFHHINPTTKLFNLSVTNLHNIATAKTKVESDKCVILCANCHRLHHHSDIKIITEEVLNAFIKYNNSL